MLVIVILYEVRTIVMLIGDGGVGCESQDVLQGTVLWFDSCHTLYRLEVGVIRVNCKIMV